VVNRTQLAWLLSSNAALAFGGRKGEKGSAVLKISCCMSVSPRISAYYKVYRFLRYWNKAPFPGFPGPMATILWPTSCGWVPTLLPKYEVDMTTLFRAMAHLAVYITWLCDLDLWPLDPKIGQHYQVLMLNTWACFEVHRPFALLHYGVIKRRFAYPVDRQPAFPWRPHNAPLVVVVLM